MGNPERRGVERNAGAFLAPDALLPVPMRTLSDDYHDAPAEPPDDRAPEPHRPRLIDRIVGAVRRVVTVERR